MNLSYRITRLAQADLDEIWDYIAENNQKAANRLLDLFQSGFEPRTKKNLVLSHLAFMLLAWASLDPHHRPLSANSLRV